MNKIYVAYLDLKGDNNTIQLIAKSNYSSTCFLHKTCEEYVNNRNSPFRIPNPFLTDIHTNIKSLLDGLYLYRVDDKRIEMYEKKTIEYTGYIYNSYGLEFNKVGLFQLVDECNNVFDTKYDNTIAIPAMTATRPPTPPPLPTNPLHQTLLNELKTKHFLKKNTTTPFSSCLKREESGLLDVSMKDDCDESSYSASTVVSSLNNIINTNISYSSSSSYESESSIPYDTDYSFNEELFSDELSSSSSSYDNYDYEHERYMNEAAFY